MKTLTDIRANLSPIKSTEQYKNYLSIIDDLIDCKENSKEEELLEHVSILVENYESIHFPIEAPDSIEAIKLMIEELGLKRKDLAECFGSTSRVSEVLTRKRPLSIEMAKKYTVA